jgi:hypothetical protein
MERGYSAIRSQIHGTIPVKVLHGLKGHCKRTVKRHSIQVHGEESVSVHNHHPALPAFGKGKADSPACSQRLFLNGIIYLERETLGRYPIDNIVLQIAYGKDYAAHAVPGQPLQDIVQERLSGHRGHTFRKVFDNGSEAGPKAARKHYSFHETAPS